MKTKFIFVTGGVYSSLGKGITASSIGRILKQLGFSVTMQKLDPYLNVDPVFISPLQHGEIFITNDGAKADLDLGNYERFIDHNLNKYSTVTSGRIYSEVIQNEREGNYNGKTVQVIPHITNQIISKLNMLAETNKTDFAIVEIGGTVGDIESLPFIHAINEFKHTHKENVLFAHCVPLISVASVIGELKTKPAQHSVKTLRSLGVDPDLLLVRSSQYVDDETKDKLSWSCTIPKTNIFECQDLKSTYFLPEELYKQKIYEPILKQFKIDKFDDNFNEWLNFTNTIKATKHDTVTVALIGENVELHDAYFSIKASLDLASYKLGVNLKIEWLNISNLNQSNYDEIFKNINCALVTPCDNLENKQKTKSLLKWLENKEIPTLSYGNAIEDVLLNHISSIPNSIYGSSDDSLFIENDYVGARESNISDTSLIDLYKNKIISERHFHKYEFNNKYKNLIDDKLELIGFNTNNNLDLIKLKNHKFYYSTYANIEFNARPGKPSPLYYKLLEMGLK